MSDATPQSIARSEEEIRQWIAGEASRAMGVARAEVDTAAALDSLGIDSLTAISMTGALAAWLNCELPATLMWDYTSIDAIARGLSRGAPAMPSLPRGIVALQPNGDLRPVFFIPGIGGPPATFAPLAAHLGVDRPSYGVDLDGLQAGRPDLMKVEEIAAELVETIRLVQGRGPYQFVGYSFGGLLAYEGARQLSEAGQTVALLALFDTFSLAGLKARSVWRRLGIHAYLLATRKSHMSHIWRQVRRRLEFRGQQGGAPESTLLADDTIARNARAAAAYHPLSYPGSIVLFRAASHEISAGSYEMDSSNGWGGLAGGGVKIIQCPGSHLTIISAAHAAANAELLMPHLID